MAGSVCRVQSTGNCRVITVSPCPSPCPDASPAPAPSPGASPEPSPCPGAGRPETTR